jgi:hypothetical protein
MAKWDGRHDSGALADELRRRLGASLKAPCEVLTEKRMFGGVCFLLRGNMLCGAGKNGYMFRIESAREAEAQRLPGGRRVVMSGRAMAGFFWVDPDACDAAALGRWLALATDYVAKMPAKGAKRRRTTARRNSADEDQS